VCVTIHIGEGCAFNTPHLSEWVLTLARVSALWRRQTLGDILPRAALFGGCFCARRVAAGADIKIIICDLLHPHSAATAAVVAATCCSRGALLLKNCPLTTARLLLLRHIAHTERERVSG